MSTDLPSSTTTITSLMNNSTISPLLTTPHPVVFVAVEDTIADVALKAKASAGLSTTISVLMSLLVTASFFLNSTLFATILSSYKLRKSVLSLMFCTLALLNLLDVLLIMLMSLLCVANSGQWIFGDGLCRLNAFVQQFVLLATLLTLTLMAVERALSLIGRHLVTCKFFGLLSLLFTVIPACFAAPLFLPGIPVTVFAYRYLCAIDSGSPIIYSIAQLLVYGGCFFVLLLCFGAILKHKRVERSLPVKPQDYGAFIMESRALEEHMNLSRVVLCLTLEFLLVEGPYICLDFFIQIRNSYELLNRWGTTELEIPQDVDTLITLVKLFHPLLVPMLIFASCADIWTKFVNLICCRRNPGQLPNSWGGQPIDGNHDMNTPNVLTIYATAEGGLQLRLPHQVVPHPSMIAAATATANGNQQQQQRREYANNQHNNNNNNYRANGLEAISEDEDNNNAEHDDDDEEEESGGAENGAVASTSQQQHWQQRTRTEVIGASGGPGLGVNMGGGEPPAEEQQEAEPAAGRPNHAANVIIKGRKRKLRRRAGGGVGGGQQQQQQPAAVRQAWKAH